MYNFVVLAKFRISETQLMYVCLWDLGCSKVHSIAATEWRLGMRQVT